MLAELPCRAYWFLGVLSFLVSPVRCVEVGWFLEVSFHGFLRTAPASDMFIVMLVSQTLSFAAWCSHFGTRGGHFGTLGTHREVWGDCSGTAIER